MCRDILTTLMRTYGGVLGPACESSCMLRLLKRIKSNREIDSEILAESIQSIYTEYRPIWKSANRPGIAQVQYIYQQ